MPGQFGPEWGGQFDAESVINYRRNQVVNFSGISSYRPYVFHLLAVAKILGVIAILTPGFPRLKEWAYAGFTFDLIGAAYSFYASGFAFKDWAFMPILLAVLACSYIFYHKRLKLKGTAA